MTTVLDKNIVKEALRELIHEEPSTFKSLLREIFIEKQNSGDDEFEQLINKNFERFEDTYKALA
jgi:hypothetical protein